MACATPRTRTSVTHVAPRHKPAAGITSRRPSFAAPSAFPPQQHGRR